MNYINFKIFRKHNLTPEQLIQLLAIKQKEVSEINTDVLSEFDSLGYITYVKGKKDALKSELVRLSDKGKKLLEDIGTPDVEEEHLKMRDYLIEMYLSHEDKERIVGNKKLIGIYISILQNYLGLDIYRFYYLCEFFLSEHTFTKKLENIFMDRNKIRYGDFKNHIEDSSLYQFYEQRKKDVEWYWAQKIKE